MKQQEILKYSNPSRVEELKNLYYGKDIPLALSTRKDKKYMIYNPKTDKWVHFGQMGMADYTKHKDETRRDQFRSRNWKWADKDPFSPAFLAYWLLW